MECFEISIIVPNGYLFSRKNLCENIFCRYVVKVSHILRDKGVILDNVLHCNNNCY